MSAQAIAFLSFPIEIPEPVDCKNLTDEELVVIYRETGGVRAREDAAAELFLRHQPRVSRWCYRFTRDRESAADLAQEILLRAFRNVNKYRGECRFSTWLYVITRNLCMSAIQKRSNEPVWVAKTLATELPDRATVDVHAEIETEETRRKSWRFILDSGSDRSPGHAAALWAGDAIERRQPQTGPDQQERRQGLCGERAA